MREGGGGGGGGGAKQTISKAKTITKTTKCHLFRRSLTFHIPTTTKMMAMMKEPTKQKNTNKQVKARQPTRQYLEQSITSQEASLVSREFTLRSSELRRR